LLCAVVFHAPILRGLAAPLVVNQPGDSSDAVAIVAWGTTPDGDHCYDAVKDLYLKIGDEKAKRRILLVAPTPNRVEQIGVLPSFETLSRRELAARGIPAESLVILHGKPGSDAATAGALGDWLHENPGQTVTLLCGDFHSGIFRRALNTTLGPADAGRVHVRALFGQKCNAANWWKFRSGFRGFGTAWVVYLHSFCCDGAIITCDVKNADDYERDFLDELWRKDR
jgi:hypothetical protein